MMDGFDKIAGSDLEQRVQQWGTEPALDLIQGTNGIIPPSLPSCPVSIRWTRRLFSRWFYISGSHSTCFLELLAKNRTFRLRQTAPCRFFWRSFPGPGFWFFTTRAWHGALNRVCRSPGTPCFIRITVATRVRLTLN